jgi:twitching motility protein PilU
MEHALAFAETGHLCISTLHANNANQALDRIINFFPEDKRQQLLLDLSLNLQAFVSQRLIPNNCGGRSAAIEVLLGSPTVKEFILRGDIADLKEIMEKSSDRGMQTFDMALYELCASGKVSEQEALKNADSANNLRLKLKLSGDPTSLAEPTLLSLQETH